MTFRRHPLRKRSRAFFFVSLQKYVTRALRRCLFSHFSAPLSLYMHRFLPFAVGLLALCAPFGALPSAIASSAATSPVAFLDDRAEPSCDVNFSLARSGAGAAQIQFDVQDPRNFYSLDLTSSNARFSISQNGKTRVLGTAPLASSAGNRLTLQRRPFEMQLLVNGHVALRAFDGTWTNGQIGTKTTGGWKIENAGVQPLELVRFDDDFTREGGGGDSDWATPSGKWSLSAASGHVSARTADMSANPFAFAVEESPSWAMATAGRKFWNDYDARVSVRPQGKGAIGFAAYVQDPKNYLAFTLSARTDSDPGTRRLVCVRDGKETVLAQASGGFVPREWLQIGLRASPGYIEAILDGAPVLRAKTEMFGQGGVGLLSRGGPSLWDDVSVRAYPFWRADFAENSAWGGAGWNLDGDGARSQAANSLLLTGRDDWSDYRVLVSTPWAATSSGGALAGYRDARNYALVRWAGNAASVAWKNKIEAVEVADGKERVVSSAPFGSPASSKRLELNAQSGAWTMLLDGHALVSLPLSQTGRFGLLAPRAGTKFSDPVVFFPPAPDPPKIASKFVDDGFMVGWASALGEWPPTPDKDGLQFWNTAELFGAWRLDMPWKENWRGKVELALFADRSDFQSGLVLHGESTGDGEGIDWILTRGDQNLKKVHVKLSDLPDAANGSGAAFHLAWNNGLLSLSDGHGAVFATPLEAPRGTAIGLRATGFRVRSGALNLWSASRDDFTFSGAPTEFYAPSGKWNVFSRWPCYGDWSFFGGSGRQPSLWTKKTYGGDIVAEYYAHPQMDMPKEPGYSHPGDLNVSLCGDGSSPASGYAFIVSGHDNTRTQIYRAGKLVADNDSDQASFHETINHNMAWHRSWVYVRASARRAAQDGKQGVLVSLSVNNEPLASYFDSSPLPSWKEGGRVCFWTLDNTLMLARAKIEAQSGGAVSVPATLRDTTPPAIADKGALSPSPLVENDESGARVALADGAWRVENNIAGGPFAVRLGDGAQHISLGTRLSLDWHASPDAKVDLYLRTGDDWHLLELCGDQKPDAMTPSLGKFKRSTSSDGWTNMTFDLGAALKGIQNVDEIRIGALHGDAYRWQGFDGNPQGAWYEWKNLVLK